MHVAMHCLHVALDPPCGFADGDGACTRQGVRMAELARAVGQMTAAQAALYSAMAPAGKRVGLEQVERLMPAARLAV